MAAGRWWRFVLSFYRCCLTRRSSFAFSLSFHRCAEAVVIPETPLYFNLASLTLGLQGSHLFMDWCVDD